MTILPARFARNKARATVPTTIHKRSRGRAIFHLSAQANKQIVTAAFASITVDASSSSKGRTIPLIAIEETAWK